MLPGLSMPLNPRFTFKTFLQADFNRMALTTAQDLARQDGALYSPLFITGGGGSGKTHLLHAIAHEAAIGGARVLLVSAEQFLSEFTTALRNHTGAAFRARYRELDILLIDDIHLLLGKKATLNEFYQTLAGLHDQGRRVGVAGDPSAMSADTSRFRGHLRWGLVVSIEQPSTEDRVRFVSAKAAYQGVELPEEVQHYLALRVRSSIRDLEGAVNRVTALARISNEPLTIDFAARALQPVSTATTALKPSIAPTDLVSLVCRYLEVNPTDITGQKRDRSLTYARHLAMYLLRQDSGLTYAAIAQILGKKDHSTVVHAVAQLHKELAVSPTLRADIDAVRASIHNSNPAA
jgi:chromosomal replication initiator protein